MTIKNIHAREILNSGGTTTISVAVALSDGSIGTASVPFGVSAGAYEAFMLFDRDARYGGKGMQKAVNNVNTELAGALIGSDAYNQKDIDEKMILLDGTQNKARLGGNAILGVSLAVARAAAASRKLEFFQYIEQHLLSKPPRIPRNLPKPMVVVIEGGVHADNSTDFQEYLIVPDIKDENGVFSVKESVRAAAEVYLELKKVLKENGYNTNVGNEGAYAPEGIKLNREPWGLISEAVERAGYVAGRDIFFAADPAASEFVAKNQQGEVFQYQLKHEDRFLSAEDMIGYFDSWIEEFPFVSLEDPLAEDDWDGWRAFTEKLGGKVRIIGDDLLVTNRDRLRRAIAEKSCNGILIKFNQIGTVTETIQTVEMAKQAGFWTIVSHRGGGETNDTSMIDLAVACGANMVKVGIARGERVCKYNRLMEIEEKLAL